MIAKYTEMGNTALAAYKKAVAQASPSKKFQEAGSYDIQGIIIGAAGEKDKLAAAQIDGIGDAVIGQAQGGHRLVELRNLLGNGVLLGGGLVFHLQQPLQSRGGGLHRVPLTLDGGQQLLTGGLRLLRLCT